MSTTPTMLEAALSYAAHGWPVLPLVPRTKRPLTTNGFKDATTDIAQIGLWWTKQHPNANIGVATGTVSGITVLDVDIKDWKSKHGDQSLAALIEKYGPLPETVSQRTWSGGMQIVFAYTPGAPNSSNCYGRDLDGRNDGGYVVVAPSVVEEDGRAGQYAWERSPFDQPLAAMPKWLLEQVKSAGARKPNDPKSSTSQPGWPETKVNGVPMGSRDEDCVRLLGRYATMRPPLSKDEVLEFMLGWAKRCQPPFDEDAVCEKVGRLFEQFATNELIRYAFTDAGNAERMVACHGNRFRWLIDAGEWLAWDGTRWAPGNVDKVRWYALDAARRFQAALARVEPGKIDKKEAWKHALRSESATGVAGAVMLARLLVEIQARSIDFDATPDLLNVANGTLDLRRFELRPHDPNDRLTRITPIPYEPTAQAPTWLAFLQDVFIRRQEVIDYVQRAVGYTLTGSIDEQCFFLLHGGGANGKSTFVTVVTSLLGEYATKLDQEAILAADKNRGRGATPELVMLVGKRFAYVDELEEGRALDEARIKALTGSERTTGRALYQNMREWHNTAKLWMDLNHLPAFKGVDIGIERRPRVIPFDRRFEDHDQDKQMAQKLLAELPGILAWAVEGCKAWRRRGLDPPEAVSLATRRYRDDNNHLPTFFEEQYVRAVGAEVSASDVQRDYQGWCALHSETAFDYQRKLVPYLRDVCHLTLARRGKQRHRVWEGIAQRAAVERVQEYASSPPASQ